MTRVLIVSLQQHTHVHQGNCTMGEVHCKFPTTTTTGLPVHLWVATSWATLTWWPPTPRFPSRPHFGSGQRHLALNLPATTLWWAIGALAAATQQPAALRASVSRSTSSMAVLSAARELRVPPRPTAWLITRTFALNLASTLAKTWIAQTWNTSSCPVVSFHHVHPSEFPPPLSLFSSLYFGSQWPCMFFGNGINFWHDQSCGLLLIICASVDPG